MNRRALVTGGAGFIGSHVVDRLLAEGHEVLVVDNLSTGRLSNLESASRHPQFTFLHADITSTESVDAVEQFRPDVVFHLAAQADVRVSVANPVFDATVNIIGSLRVIEAAVKGGAQRIVAAASGGTLYGEVDPSDLPISESMPWQPLAPYGISKKVMIDYLRSAQAIYGIETTSLALGNVFGPRQDPHGEAGVIAIFFQHYQAATTPTVFGTGDQTRDFIYVEDVVSAFLAASERTGTGALFNIGTGIETSVRDLVNYMNRITRSEVEPVRAPARAGELDRSVLDITAASHQLHWSPRVGIEEGLIRTWQWFQQVNG
ncbi:MAG: SDR family NAD(P)-dependent oxidoreductase [Acidobacteria bacterium]|nr:SDR family NAD(P)-dependent oxidoreductase [Acidobacteriota bacterium]